MSEQLKYHILEQEADDTATLYFVREDSQEVKYSRLKHQLQVRIQTLSSAQ